MSSHAAGSDERPVVLFLGDSLTAGYGLAAEQAYPALIQTRIDAESLEFRSVNAGVSGDTTAGGLSRVDWLLRQPIAVLVVALGGNDMLRGLSVEAMRANLRGILERVRSARPETRFVVAGIRAAPNLGGRYARELSAVFEEVADEFGASLIPFLLEGVAANPALNLPDGVHPNAAGQEVVAELVWTTLAPVLREVTTADSRGGRAASASERNR